MRLTDQDLATIFKYGMSVTKLDDPDEDDIPLRGVVEPARDDDDAFAFFINEFAGTWYSREVEPDGTGGYIVDTNWGEKLRLFPIPESQKFVLRMDYIDQMKEFFGPGDTWPVFRAVSEDHDLDFNAIMIPEKDDDYGPFIGHMRPNAEKDFYMEISDTEKHATEWIVTTTNGRWALRRLPRHHAYAFIEELRKEGTDVG